MATSIAIVTESTDHYNYSVDKDLTAEEAIEYIKDALGEEAPYASYVSVVLSNGNEVPLHFDFFTLLDE